MRVYLDDEREAPEGWVRVRTAAEAIAKLRTGQVDEISLDNDLGAEEVCGTGYGVICWIETMTATVRDFTPPEIHIHTANPVAREKMLAARRKIYKELANRLAAAIAGSSSSI